MRYTRTAITQLTKMYRSVLKKCAFLNALILTGVVAASPSWADYINTETTAFQFGDVSIAGQEYMDNTAFGGRRGAWTDGKYLNTFPQYQLEGRSFGLSGSKAYVGPVELTLRELTDADHLIYNYQLDGNDVDLANLAHVDFGNTQSEIVAGVAGVIGAGNAAYTAPGVVAFANRDNSKAAGSMTVTNSNMVIDGATVNANTINVSSSNLTFAQKGADLLTAGLSPEVRFYTNAANIDSDGKSALNADTMTFDGSRMIVNAGAELTINPTTSATISNATVEGDGGAIYNEGTITLNNATFGAVDNSDPEHPVYSNGNTATGNGGAIYNAGTLTVNDSNFYDNSSTGANGGAIYINASTEDSSIVTTINNSKFAGNRATSLSAGADSGAITLRYGKLVVDGSIFTDNSAIEGGAIESYKKNNYMEISDSTFQNNQAYAYGAVGIFGFGGTNTITDSHFIGNRSTDSDPAAAAGAVYAGSDAHFLVSGTEFTGNNSASSGGAIATRGTVNGSVIKENNANGYLDIVDSTFTNNVAGSNGGAIDNTFYHSSTNADAVTVKGSTFIGNQAAKGGAIYNHGEKDNNGAGVVSAMVVENGTFTNNSATNAGGAIYNEGVITFSGTNTFTGNTAGGNGNDIDGATNGSTTGLINIANGVTTVSTIKNQTVAVNGGELHLTTTADDGSNLAGSTVTVASGAIANTIDGVINNYATPITLADGAKVKLDADLSGATIDTFAGSGSINIDGVNITSDGAGGSLTVASGATIVVAENATAYTTAEKYTVVGSDEAGVGKIKITKEGTGAGGLENAVADTESVTPETVTYNLTNNDTVDSAVKVENANFTINGDGTETSDKGVTLTAELGVDGNSTLTIDNTKIAGDGGSLSNDAGGTVNINESKIDVALTNQGTVNIDSSTVNGAIDTAGTVNIDSSTVNGAIDTAGTVNIVDGTINGLVTIKDGGSVVSDPTIYNAGVVVESGGSIVADGDTFQNTDRTGANGGAIWNEAGGSVTLTNVTISGNTADNGGGIYNAGTLSITDTNFSNNTAVTNGGAIYSAAAATINATGANVSFTGNTAGGNANDIYMQGADGADVTLALNAAAGQSITLNGGVAGQYYDMNINAATAGDVALGDVAGVDAITVGGGAVSATTVDANSLALNGGTFATTNASTIDTLTTAATTTFTAGNTLGVATALTNAGTLTANGALAVQSGSNSGTINGTGALTLGDGTTTVAFGNTGLISNAISNTAKSTFTTVGVDDTTTPTVGFTGDVANAGTLDVTAGTINSNVSGVGALKTADGVAIATGKTVAQGSLDVTGTLTNAGTLTVAGNITGSSTPTITGAGDINLNGGTAVDATAGNAAVINSTGDVTIGGFVASTAAITAKDIAISAGKYLSIGAGNLTDTNDATIANAGTLSLSTGTLANAITGDGATVIAGAVINNSAITQATGGVTVSSGSLTNNAEKTITAAVTNNATVNNAGTITGNIVNNAGAAMTTSANNIATGVGSTITNDGTLTFNAGTISKNIAKVTAGGGIVEIAGDVGIAAGTSITDNAVKLSSGTFDVTALDTTTTGNIDVSAIGTGLVANGGTLDVQDGKTGTITLGAVNTDAAALNVAIDAQFTTGTTTAAGITGTADIISGSVTTAANKIQISNIAITADPAATEFKAQIADAASKGNVALTATTLTGLSVGAGDVLLGYDSTTGFLTGGHNTLTDAITSTIDQKVFNLTADDSTALATDQTLAGTSLSITGNSHTISGDGTLSVASGKTLSLNNTTFSADIANAGDLNLGGTTTINGEVSGVGDATVLADSTVAINDTFTQDSLTIAAPSDGNATTVTANAGNLVIENGIDNDGTLALTGGTLAADIEGDGTTQITGDVTVDDTNGSIAQDIDITAGSLTAKADNLTGDDINIKNGAGLTLTGGELDADINGYADDPLDPTTTTYGALSVTGNTTLNGTTTVDALTVADDITLDADDDVTVNTTLANTGEITGDGDLTLLGAAMSNAGTISAASIIIGNGTDDAALTNAATGLITSDVFVDENAKLTTAGVDDVDDPQTGITGDIDNDGSLELTGGTVVGDIDGAGTLTTTADVTIDEDADVEQGTLVVGNNTTLTSDGGLTVTDTLTNGGEIAGDGSLTLLGANMENAGTISIESVTVGDGTNATAFENTGLITSDVEIADGSSLETAGVDDVDYPTEGVTGTIANDGALTLTGGTVVGAVTGAGSTEISGDTTLAAAVTQTAGIAVDTGVTLTSDANNIQSAVTNTGTGTLELTGGALNQNVTGGNLDINGDVAIATTADVVSTSATTITAGNTLTTGDNAVTLGDTTIGGTLTAGSGDVTLGDTTVNGTLDVGTNDNVTTGNTTVGATGSVEVEITDLANGSSTYTGGQLNVNGNLTTDSDSKLKLDIADGLLEDQHSQSGGLNVVSVTGTGGFTGDQIEVSGDYNVTVNPDGSIAIVNKNSYADVSSAAIGNANNVSAATGWDNATNLPDGSLARDIQKTLNKISKNNPGAYVNALTNLAPTDSALYQSVALEVSNLINEQVTDRLKSQGMNSGDVFERQGAWIKTFYNHAEQDSDRNTPGFTGKTKGIAFGLDGQVDENTTFGVGYAYNTTDADSLNKDIDITGHNIFAYGKYQPSSWFVRGMVNYGLSDYEEKSHVLGFVKTADYDVKNYGLRTYVGYDLPNGFTPEAGLRYTHLTVENYMDSLGQVVRTDDIDILTATLGVNFQKDVETFGYKWTPKAHFGVTYDLANDGADASVVLGNSAYNINGEALDRFGIEAGVGAEINMGDWSLSAEYEYGYRDNFENHTGMLQLKYNF